MMASKGLFFSNPKPSFAEVAVATEKACVRSRYTLASSRSDGSSSTYNKEYIKSD
jgi:hypothetical protein